VKEYQPAIGQDLDGADSASVSKQWKGVTKLGWIMELLGVLGIGDREDKEPVAHMIADR
jgi:hypothetical protein